MRLPKLLSTASFKLTSLYLLLFLVSVGALATLLFFTLRAAFEAEVRTQITNEVNLLLFEYREDGLDELLEETEERIEKNESGDRLLYMVQNPAGDVIFDRVEPVSGTYGWRRGDGDAPKLFYFTRLPDGHVLGVGKDLTAYGAMEQALLRAFAWALAAVLVVGAVGGLILSRRTLAQVDGITRTARAIGDGRLSQRVAVRRNGDEFDALGATLNRMLDRIEQLVANVRDVSTGIAHDLRTPLARLRQRLEDLRARTAQEAQQAELGTAIAEVDAILQTFAALLRLAEVNAGTLRAGFRPVDLSSLVRQVAEAYEPLGEDRDIVLETGIEERIELLGDAHLLQQLLANLLENALQHAGRGLTVALRLHQEPVCTVLEVADNGRGIPAADREKMLRPFERIDTGHGGSGLGLALAAAIARLHEADLQLLDNYPGLLCRVAFPTPRTPVADA
jgi:signal transduction histidine kinase